MAHGLTKQGATDVYNAFWRAAMWTVRYLRGQSVSLAMAFDPAVRPMVAHLAAHTPEAHPGWLEQLQPQPGELLPSPLLFGLLLMPQSGLRHLPPGVVRGPDDPLGRLAEMVVDGTAPDDASDDVRAIARAATPMARLHAPWSGAIASCSAARHSCPPKLSLIHI